MEVLLGALNLERLKDVLSLAVRGEPFEALLNSLLLAARGLPLHGPGGNIVKWLGTGTDIHEQKLAEDALQLANRRKDEFLAMLAHELRNPLAPISAAEQVQPLLDARRHTPVPAMQAGAHTVVQGDRARLIQVVANLLANAAKYTAPGGRIELALETDAAGGGGNGDGAVARIRIADNGSGIDTALLPHVFELFTQGARTPDRAQGGLGLGLALVRTIVLAHGGEVRAESAGAGCGSIFTVELPLVRAHAPGPAAPMPDAAAAPQPAPVRHALRVLLVDDNHDAASTLASLLEAAGHRVMALHDPAAALRAAPSFAPQAFILDIGLPGMDGYALARALSRQADFDHHLVKPADPARLLALLDAHATAAVG